MFLHAGAVFLECEDLHCRNSAHGVDSVGAGNLIKVPANCVAPQRMLVDGVRVRVIRREVLAVRPDPEANEGGGKQREL